MPLSPEQVRTLKQVNVSKDAEKTKQRVAQDFKSAKRAEQRAIDELSGQARSAIYRVFKTGSVNARIVMAMAQILNVTPQYYTGETDEKEPADDGRIRQFLETHGYEKLLSEFNGSAPKRIYNKKPKAADVPVVEAASMELDVSEEDEGLKALKEAWTKTMDSIMDMIDDDLDGAFAVPLVFSGHPDMHKAVEELGEDEAKVLLHSLFIRARGGGEAAFLLDAVKRCLLK